MKYLKIRDSFLWFLAVVGLFSSIAFLAPLFLLYMNKGPFNREKSEYASVKDVRYVLNGCGLGEERIQKVVHSYHSARSLAGDHMDAFAIQVTRLDISELSKLSRSGDVVWYRGDKLNELAGQAVSFTRGWVEAPWLPLGDALRTKDYYVYPHSVLFYGPRVISAQLIYVRPADRMVFFFDGKT